MTTRKITSFSKAPTQQRGSSKLRALLVSLSSEEPAVIDGAVTQLESAIADYRAYARPLRAGSGRREGFRVAETRKELARLVTTLCTALAAYEHLSPPAISLLSAQIDHKARVRAAHLRDTADAAHRALGVAKRQPDRQADTHRNALALKVALVLRDILHIKPSSTRHNHIKSSGTRGGAKFSRVLEHVLKRAVGHSTDLEKQIAAGLRLLNDPDLPHNLP